MKNRWFSPRMILAYAVVLLVVLWRLFTEIPNFTPVMALALFLGSYFGKRHIALIIPLTGMFISDLIIGMHSTILFVYVAFALAVGIGVLLRKHINFGTIVAGALGSSIVFFLITNLGAWLASMGAYPMTFSGLMASYAAGIPFFRTELLSTLMFSGLFFGAYHLLKKYNPSFATG